jgi:hypothetical protein
MTEPSSSTNEIKLEAQGIARGDPLLRWLSRIGVSSILIGAVYAVAFRSLNTLASWRAGHLRTVGTVTGHLDDPSTYTVLVAGAVIFAYYTWAPRGIATLFKGLYENGVIGDPIRQKDKGNKDPEDDNVEKHPYESFLEEMQRAFGKWWWSAASLAIAVGATLLLVLPQYLELGQDAWWTADYANMTLALVYLMIGLYNVLLQLIYWVISIYWLRRLFKSFAINARPLYPDGAGGLSPLGNFTLSLSYIIAFVGFMLVLTPITRNFVVAGTLQFRWTSEIVIGLGIYLVTAPIVFFGPLAVAHRVMRKAKHDLLLQIAQRFDTEYTHLQKALSGGSSGLKNHSEMLNELQSLHKMASKFPVWPFNLENITRFVTVYFLPFVVPLFLELLGLVFGL